MLLSYLRINNNSLLSFNVHSIIVSLNVSKNALVMGLTESGFKQDVHILFFALQ